MTILPLNPAENNSPQALLGFFEQCRALAVAKSRAQLVSITLEVGALDPLAVLESIFEPGERHFYVERPVDGVALAGAEAALEFTAEGPDRFKKVQDFIDETLANSLVVGDQSAPFSGPHFFTAFSFFDQSEAGDVFKAAQVFVPRWQVGVRDGRTVAVANVLIDRDSPLSGIMERVWRARQKFGAFDYSEPEFEAPPVVAPVTVSEVGGEFSYVQAVAKGLERIKAGEFDKIVLARAKDVVASAPLHPLRILNGLRERFSECYAFSAANGQGQSFIGASPERLLRVRQGKVLTEALAGSTRRGTTASEDAALGGALLRSEKDRKEQELVVQSIVRRLTPLGLHLQVPTTPTLRRLANVQHLHSPLTAELPADVRLLDVLAVLHPTPAVGGTPREPAVARIRELETFSRGLYAGALGWLDSRGDGEFLVGLRSALIDGPRARLYAGAGIVAGSVPEKELIETELKFRAMQGAIVGA